MVEFGNAPGYFAERMKTHDYVMDQGLLYSAAAVEVVVEAVDVNTFEMILEEFVHSVEPPEADYEA